MDENKIKELLEQILAKNDGALTAKAQEEMLKVFGSSLADELTKKFEDKFGKIEQHFNAKDAEKKEGAFKSFSDFALAVKNYQSETNQNKLKALETGVQGEFIIPPTYVSGILGTAQESNPFMQMATKFPLAGNSASISFFKDKTRTSANFYGGVVSYWVEEGNAPTASDMQFGKMNLRLHDLALLIPATNDMIEDAPEAIGGLVSKAFGERIAYDLENVFLNGTGVGQPLGILNSAAKVEQAKVTNQTAATIVSNNLTSMWSRLPKASKANAIWIYGADVYSEIVNCKVGASDFPAFIPAGGMAGAAPTLDRLLGKPAYESEHISAALGTAGDIILVDPTQYAVAFKSLTAQVESSTHLYFDSNKTAFRLVFRIDGQPMWDTYLTPAQGSVTKSPIVTLATRA